MLIPRSRTARAPTWARSTAPAIVPLSAEQRAVAAAYIAQLDMSGLWDKPIVTRIERAQGFFPAEAYHQDYMEKNPRNPYIARWDAPKLKALKGMYPAYYSATPAD